MGGGGRTGVVRLTVPTCMSGCPVSTCYFFNIETSLVQMLPCGRCPGGTWDQQAPKHQTQNTEPRPSSIHAAQSHTRNPNKHFQTLLHNLVEGFLVKFCYTSPRNHLSDVLVGVIV